MRYARLELQSARFLGLNIALWTRRLSVDPHVVLLYRVECMLSRWGVSDAARTDSVTYQVEPEVV